jgi:muramidase (phage lysozyme)
MATALPVDDTVKRLQRSLENLTRSLDSASNDAIDKATDAISDLIKQSKLLSDAESQKIKDAKSVTAAMEKLRDQAKEYKRLQMKLNAGTIKHMEVYDALIKKGITPASKSLADLQDALELEIKAHASLTDSIDHSAKSLERAGSKFGRVLEDGKSKVAEFTVKTASAGFALGKLKEGAEVLYKTGVKLANRGLLTSMMQMTTSALALRMGTEEFIDLIEKNRDTVMAFGGGAKGILAFTNQIEAASSGLEYMGKDGKKATAQFMASFMRSGGTVNEFTASSKLMNQSFKTLQETIGTTVDEFSEYIEEINSSQMIQAKLNLGDKAAAIQLRQEAMARTDQYAALQLTTKQMIEMNKTLETMYNPNKNRQAEVMKQRAYAKIAINSTSNEMRQNGRGNDADILDAGMRDGSVDAVLKGSKDPKYAALMRAMDNMRAFNTEVRGGDDASMKNYLGVEMADKSQILQQAQATGAIYNKADAQRGSNQGQSYGQQKKNADNAGLAQDAFTLVRDSVESVSSILNTVFTPAVLGAAAALATMIGPARLLAAGRAAAGWAAGAAGGGAAAGAGAGAGAAGAAGAGAGAAGAGAAAGGMSMVAAAALPAAALGMGVMAQRANKQKIEANPNAPEFKDNPYAMVLRGEAKTLGQAAAMNQRKALRSRWNDDGTTATGGGGSGDFSRMDRAGTVPRSAPGAPGANSALLAQIAQGEGTSDATAQKHGFQSGYDVTLGYGAYNKKTDKPLSQMTIGEVKQLQKEMLANPANKMNSSAAGKYQIVGTTLRSLQKDMGVGDDALFDGKMQDSMATELLKRRGLNSFQSGNMGAGQFQSNLSKEWASIANPNTGRSYYGQATGTSSQAIQTAMKGLTMPGLPDGANTTGPTGAPVTTGDALVAETKTQTQLLAQLVNQGKVKNMSGKADKRTALEQG